MYISYPWTKQLNVIETNIDFVSYETLRVYKKTEWVDMTGAIFLSNPRSFNMIFFKCKFVQ